VADLRTVCGALQSRASKVQAPQPPARPQPAKVGPKWPLNGPSAPPWRALLRRTSAGRLLFLLARLVHVWDGLAGAWETHWLGAFPVWAAPPPCFCSKTQTGHGPAHSHPSNAKDGPAEAPKGAHRQSAGPELSRCAGQSPGGQNNTLGPQTSWPPPAEWPL